MHTEGMSMSDFFKLKKQYDAEKNINNEIEYGGRTGEEYNINIKGIEKFNKFSQKFNSEIGKAIKHNMQAACSVFVQDGEDSWIGSGFAVKSNDRGTYIATASHVCPPNLSDKAIIYVNFDTTSNKKAKIVISEPKYDSAILFVKEPNMAVVKLANSDKCEIGDDIATIGNPEGFINSATTGIISNIHQGLGENAPSDAWNDIILITADVAQGASGGMCLQTDGLVAGSIMGVTGAHAASAGIGQRVICPSNKIQALIISVGVNLQ